MRKEEIKSKKVVVKLPEDHNLPDTFKRDRSSLAYAIKHKIVFLLVDKFSGKIWNFSTCKYTQEDIDYYTAYPHMANCVSMSISEYIRKTN